MSATTSAASSSSSSSSSSGQASTTATMDVDYRDEFMQEAFKEAKIALASSEVPVGCVFVDPTSQQVIARGHNQTNARHNALEHAELVAISSLLLSDNNKKNAACKKIRGSFLYVTVEPCIMCAAALLYHGIRKVFFGCRNPRFGGNGTILSIHQDNLLQNQTPQQQNQQQQQEQKQEQKDQYESLAGFREEEAILLLQQFYEQENPSAPESKVKRRIRD